MCAPATAQAGVPRSGVELSAGTAASSAGHVALLGDQPLGVRIAQPGGPLSAPLGVPGAETAYGLEVAVGPAGEALVLWSPGGPQAAQLMASFRPAGGTFGPAELISDDNLSYGEQTPVIAFDAGGTATVVWTRGQTREDLAVRTRSPDGAWSEIQSIPAPYSFRPSLVVSDDGSATLATTTRSSARSEINRLVVTSRPPGGSFGPLQTVSRKPVAGSVVLAANDAGHAALLWISGDLEQGTEHILGAFRRPAGRFGTPRRVSRRGAGGVYPSVSVAVDGRTLMAWSREPNGTIYARARTPAGQLQPIQTLTRRTAVNANPAALATQPGSVTWFDRVRGQSLLRTATFDDQGAVASRSLLLRIRRYEDEPRVFAAPGQTIFVTGDRILRRPLP